MVLILAWLALQPLAVPAGQEGPTADERRLLDPINVERRERRLNPLSWEPTLARLARAHASDMKFAGRITHFSSRDGADFATRLGRTRLRVRAAAENVAYDRDLWRAHRVLMTSPGHRRNLLDPELTAIGIGIARSDEERSVYVVEDFATPKARHLHPVAIEPGHATARSRRIQTLFVQLTKYSLIVLKFRNYVECLFYENFVTFCTCLPKSVNPQNLWITLWTICFECAHSRTPLDRRRNLRRINRIYIFYLIYNSLSNFRHAIDQDP